QHVPDEAVADDDVGQAPGHVLPLDVADKIELGRLQELVRLLDQGIALGLLLAVAEQADARRRDAANEARVALAHNRELLEVDGATIRVRADVEDEAVTLGGWEDGCQGGPLNAGQATEPKERRDHRRAGVAGGDE